MGGGVRSSSSFSASPDDHSSLDDDNSHCSSDGLGLEIEEEAKIPTGFDSGEFDQMSYQGNSSNHVSSAGDLRRRLALNADLANVMNKYYINDCRDLYEARRLLLSYTPGSWIDKARGEKLSDFDVPKATTLLVVGFKGSGKSSLINRISRVFEDEKLASDRAQVSYDSSSLGDGTHFLHGYMIPRCSSSICLFDTRGLSYETRDNDDLIKSWMTNGVRNGELVIKESDNPSLKDTLKCKIRDGEVVAEPIRKVNFVIFAVDGLSVLRFMNSNKEEDTRRAETLARTYNSPYLSFGDDKPVIVVTRGDLLSQEERTRVRIYLGELLGVPPTTQIFDIPESREPGDKLATLEMLKYALEHADKNLSRRSWTCSENLSRRSSTCSDPSCDKRSLGQVYGVHAITLIILGIAFGVTVATILVWSQPLGHCAPLSNHESLVNRTVDHPAQPQINSTTHPFCYDHHHHQDPETTRETNQTVNLDLSYSTTQSCSEPSRATNTGQEQQTPVRPEPQTPVKPKTRKAEHKSRAHKQRTPVKPKTRKTEHKSRAHKQQKAEDVLDSTINWEARKRLWLVE